MGAIVVLMCSVTTSALADKVQDEIATFGKAGVIIVIDPAKLREPQETPDKAVIWVSKLIAAHDRAHVRRLGWQAMIVGAIGKESHEALRGAPGVRVVLDSLSPPLASARQLVGLSDIEPTQTPVPRKGVHVPGSVTRSSSHPFAVVVLDTGFDTQHPFIKHAILRQACFSTARSPSFAVRSLCPNGWEVQTRGEAANPCAINARACEHGTHVAGLIAGKSGNDGSTYFDGISPTTPLILITAYTEIHDVGFCVLRLKEATPCFASFLSDQIEALEYVRQLSGEHFIAAVNMSMGSAPDGECAAHPLAVPVASLLDVGIPVVAAAGNNGKPFSLVPGCLDDAVTVAASDQDGNFAATYPSPWRGGSNFSKEVDVVAPGVNLYSAQPGGAYVALTGTSQAAPLVAAAIARIRTMVAVDVRAPWERLDLAGLSVTLAIKSPRTLSLGAAGTSDGFDRPALDVTTGVGEAASLLAAAGGSEIAVPAGAPDMQIPPKADVPGLNRSIVEGSEPFNSDDIETLENLLTGELGQGKAKVFRQMNPNRIVVDSLPPIDRAMIEDFVARSGKSGIAYDDALGSFKF